MIETSWTAANGDPAVVTTIWDGTETAAEFAARHAQEVKDKQDEVGVKLGE